MRFRLLLVLTACVLLAADKPSDEAVKKEWKRLEGTWVLTKMEVNGKSLLEKDKPAPRIVIKDGKVLPDPKQAPKGTNVENPTVLLDPSRKPKTINVPNFKGGQPEKGVTLIGIYELKGNVLRVCVEGVETARLKEREKDRPKAFDSKQGALLVFKRKGK
jgi:uncharacterized protein (TIGR03067 family)